LDAALTFRLDMLLALVAHGLAVMLPVGLALLDEGKKGKGLKSPFLLSKSRPQDKVDG
jgi:hypothetical protein